MRYISHLDLMRLLQRALRRASLPVMITQGFSPHLKVSIPKALKLGVESRSEEMTVHMSRDTDINEFRESLNANLPDGVRITSAQEIG